MSLAMFVSYLGLSANPRGPPLPPTFDTTGFVLTNDRIHVSEIAAAEAAWQQFEDDPERVAALEATLLKTLGTDTPTPHEYLVLMASLGVGNRSTGSADLPYLLDRVLTKLEDMMARDRRVLGCSWIATAPLLMLALCGCFVLSFLWSDVLAVKSGGSAFFSHELVARDAFNAYSAKRHECLSLCDFRDALNDSGKARLIEVGFANFSSRTPCLPTRARDLLTLCAYPQSAHAQENSGTDVAAPPSESERGCVVCADVTPLSKGVRCKTTDEVFVSTLHAAWVSPVRSPKPATRATAEVVTLTLRLWILNPAEERVDVFRSMIYEITSSPKIKAANYCALIALVLSTMRFHLAAVPTAVFYNLQFLRAACLHSLVTITAGFTLQLTTDDFAPTLTVFYQFNTLVWVLVPLVAWRNNKPSDVTVKVLVVIASAGGFVSTMWCVEWLSIRLNPNYPIDITVDDAPTEVLRRQSMRLYLMAVVVWAALIAALILVTPLVRALCNDIMTHIAVISFLFSLFVLYGAVDYRQALIGFRGFSWKDDRCFDWGIATLMGIGLSAFNTFRDIASNPGRTEREEVSYMQRMRMLPKRLSSSSAVLLLLFFFTVSVGFSPLLLGVISPVQGRLHAH